MLAPPHVSKYVMAVKATEAGGTRLLPCAVRDMLCTGASPTATSVVEASSLQ